jgi:predicted alpha/beta hydrolase family esterase
MASQGNVYSSLGNDRTNPPETTMEGDDVSPAKLQRAVEASKARLAEWSTSLEDGVRQRPMQSVLIAAGIGALVGLLIGRGSR